jgi:Fe2+ transport system protein FeoA
MTLAELPLGEKAEVVALSQHCTGLGRRRLLDLGFTPGTRIEAVLTSAQDSAHAYRIRETLIALRREQAQDVLIRRPVAQTHATSGSTAVSPC